MGSSAPYFVQFCIDPVHRVRHVVDLQREAAVRWIPYVMALGVLSACQEPGLGGQEGEPASPQQDTGGWSDGGTTGGTDGGGGGTDGGGTDGGMTDGGGTDSDTVGGGGTDGEATSTGGVDTGGGDSADTGGDTADTGLEECDDVSEVTLYLSPDDSNSMSSPVQAREAVLSGWTSISNVPIRTYEFMNYYSFDYEAAEAGALRVQLDMLQGDDAQYTLQIGVSSPELSNADRAAMNITLVLDESGSMSGDPMDMLKASCRAIAGSLKEGDIVSLVTWDTSNAVLLDSHAVTGPDDTTLLNAISSLEPGGGTDLHGGLIAGYGLAQKNYEADRINRIVLISDGGANAGVTDIDTIAAAAGGEGEDGIYMVGVGVGSSSSYNDELMDAVTDAGKGASVFIPSEAEAERIFGERFVEVMDVAARDVQVRLELPPGFEIVRFSGEEYSTDPAEVEPQNIAPSDAMVFYQSVETCAPELLSDDVTITATARYLDPITFTESETSQVLSLADLAAADTALIRKGAAVYGYAEALKAYKTAVTAEERSAIVAEALAAVEAAELENPGDEDLAEIRSVLEAL